MIAIFSDRTSRRQLSRSQSIILGALGRAPGSHSEQTFDYGWRSECLIKMYCERSQHSLLIWNALMNLDKMDEIECLLGELTKSVFQEVRDTAPEVGTENDLAARDEAHEEASRPEKLSFTPTRSLGGYLDYDGWPDCERFLELDEALLRRSRIRGTADQQPIANRAAEQQIIRRCTAKHTDGSRCPNTFERTRTYTGSRCRDHRHLYGLNMLRTYEVQAMFQREPAGLTREVIETSQFRRI